MTQYPVKLSRGYYPQSRSVSIQELSRSIQPWASRGAAIGAAAGIAFSIRPGASLVDLAGGAGVGAFTGAIIGCIVGAFIEAFFR